MCFGQRRATRVTGGSRREYQNDEVGSLGRKLNDLLKMDDLPKQLHHLTKPPATSCGLEERFASGTSLRKACVGLTGLMHAARGGLSTFEMVLDRIELILSKCDHGLSLRTALGLDPTPEGLAASGGEVDNEVDYRIEQLMAQAALGGDVDVLTQVASAVSVRRCLLLILGALMFRFCVCNVPRFCSDVLPLYTLTGSLSKVFRSVAPIVRLRIC